MSETNTAILPQPGATPQEGGGPPRMPAPPALSEEQRRAAGAAVLRFLQARYARSESARRLMDEALAAVPADGLESPASGPGSREAAPCD